MKGQKMGIEDNKSEKNIDCRIRLLKRKLRERKWAGRSCMYCVSICSQQCRMSFVDAIHSIQYFSIHKHTNTHVPIVDIAPMYIYVHMNDGYCI